jgi:putative flavoprotein involved in K+ transport
MTIEQTLPAQRPAHGAEHVETVVIGGGQAGLATAHHLTRRGRPCLVLEADDRVGDVWRHRFDSLRLFTPARYDGLDGLPMTVPGWEFPTTHQMADYLETYAETLKLPVRTGVSVDNLSHDGDRYVITSGHRVITADNVVVASGTWQSPIVPEFADALDPSIRQLHSAEYRNPAQLQPGPVLCVGASHSGADIALEMSRSHETHLSGRIQGEIPFRIESRVAHVVLPLIWFAWNHVLTERTPIGRKVRDHVRRGGGPLIRVKLRDLEAAGVHYTEHRVTGVSEGRPLLADGTVLDVGNVVWCTGFGKDTDWIDVPIGDGPWPAQSRGVVAQSPGLYFVGLPFLRGFYSMLVGGVSRDADYVAGHIARRSTSAGVGSVMDAPAERALPADRQAQAL